MERKREDGLAQTQSWSIPGCLMMNMEKEDRSPKGDHTSATYSGLLWKEMSVPSLVTKRGMGMRTKRT